MPSSEHPEFCYSYVLRSVKTKEFYVGSTTDLKQRFAEHQNGFNRSTKSGRPWKLIYYEARLSHEDARRRERYLKSSAGSRTLHSVLRNSLASMTD